MNVKSLKIPEILLITPEIHNDERGSFLNFLIKKNLISVQA